jgi:uncharacterized protein (DUF2235 family)
MSKRIAIFSDGTGQATGRNDSNVLRACKMLDLSYSANQVAIYDPGIGTHAALTGLQTDLKTSDRMRLADANPRSHLLRRLRRPLELGFGLGLEANIKQLYRALIDVYEPDDAIYLFGFSRGAFTVRALAGLIYRCGLLKSDAIGEIDSALAWCRTHYTALNEQQRAAYRNGVNAFRRRLSRPCAIRFLGVWDTVKSVGYLRPKNLPHTRHNPIVRTIRHALSLDERRSFYTPTTWGGLATDTRPAVYAPASFDLDETDAPPGSPQDVQEVWFAGNHSDVGGGYPTSERSAANNSLRWMIAEARNCCLRFDENQYRASFARDADEPITHRHDEMKSGVGGTLWRVIEWCPRLELQNEPPPPRTQWAFRPAGARPVGDSLRHAPDSNRVSVHVSARDVYGEAGAPWRGLPVKFVATL